MLMSSSGCGGACSLGLILLLPVCLVSSGDVAQSHYTGTSLELFSHWSAPHWSQQPNGTVCAAMPLADFLRLQALFAEVASFLASLGVRWLISHGSLLGAWLHHTAVPWDEEGDLVLLPEDFGKLENYLGPPSGAKLKHANGGRMWLYEGPAVGSLQYDYHKHMDENGGWLATAVTFRHRSEPRTSNVHVDAFLARTNGTHAWTDSAVIPLDVLLPTRWLRFYDWLVPGPNDPKAALQLWYGPHFVGRRKCPLRRPGAELTGIEQIAEVSGREISLSYPLAKSDWVQGDELRCTVHRNRTVLWTLGLETRTGRLLSVQGLLGKPHLVRLGARLGREAGAGGAVTAGQEYVHKGEFPRNVPNMWD